MRSFDPNQRPVILSHLGEKLSETIALHPSRPIVHTDTDSTTPWILQPGTQILLTRALQAWRRAPATRPDGLAPLLWVQTMSAGTDIYPSWLFEGARVSTGQGLTAPAIAEYVIAAILRRVKPLEALAARPGHWKQQELGSVIGQRVGLVGFGAIGRQIARNAQPLGMEVRALRRRQGLLPEGGVTFVSDIEALLTWSDHLVLAVPATPETRGVISRARMTAARPGLHLINVSRGELVDQEALIAALDAGRLSFATLDVTAPEPLPEDHPLLSHPKVLVTPHIAWSNGTNPEVAFARRVLRGLDALMEGREPAYQIDPAQGY